MLFHNSDLSLDGLPLRPLLVLAGVLRQLQVVPLVHTLLIQGRLRHLVRGVQETEEAGWLDEER